MPECLNINYAGDTFLPLGEILYTARGSQGIGMGTYLANKINIDPEKFSVQMTIDFITTDKHKE